MYKRLISICLVLLLMVIPGFTASQAWWDQEGGEVLGDLQAKLEIYQREKGLVVSETFDQELSDLITSLLAIDGGWAQLQDPLADFLNELLTREAVIRQEMIAQAAASTKAQDYNSSRSNRPRTTVFIEDDEAADEFLLLANRLEIRIPIEAYQVMTLAELVSLVEGLATADGGQELLAGLYFASQLESMVKESTSLSSCEKKSYGLGFVFFEENHELKSYLQEAFFIPLGINEDLDCNDTDEGPMPGEVAKEELVFTLGQTTVVRNGQEEVIPKAPYVEEKTTMVPFRYIGEAIGADLNWIGEEKQIIYQLGDLELKLWIGSSRAQLNGQDITIDTSPRIFQGTSFVPLRFVAENLGFEVTYDNELKTIQLIKGSPLYEGESKEAENPLYNEE